jgi:hypothetical protein
MPDQPKASQSVCCPKCGERFDVQITPPRVTGQQYTKAARELVETSKIDRGAFGRPACPFCKHVKKSDHSLIKHLAREHREELEERALALQKK